MPLALIIFMAMMQSVASQNGGDSPTPEQQYQILYRKWEGDWQAFVKANEGAKTVRDRAELDKLPGMKPILYAAEFMSLARMYPGTSAAEDSLIWVASHVIYGRETEEAQRVLVRDHIRSDQLAPVFAYQVHSVGSQATESLLRSALAETPHRRVRGMACYWLARYQLERSNAARGAKLSDQPKIPPPAEITDGWGLDFYDRLKLLDLKAMDREAESLFNRVICEFADIAHNDKRRPPGTLGKASQGFLRDLCDLAVGKPAPTVEGDDLDGLRFRLDDYRGKVVVLDFGSHFFCGACREMYPHERAMVKRLAAQPFALVTIDVDDKRAEVQAAWKDEGHTWRCVYEPTIDGPINTAWNINFFPTIFVIDRRGVIRFKAIGDPGEELDRVVAELIAE